MAIQNNQKVAMMYQLTIDGKIEDSNIGAEPLEFIFGTGQIIPGLEVRIKDMSIGDKQDITVPPAEAYGEYNPLTKQAVQKEVFDGVDLQVGMPLQGTTDEGKPFNATVDEILDDQVVIDLNHPLAGKELHFNIEIISID